MTLSDALDIRGFKRGVWGFFLGVRDYMLEIPYPVSQSRGAEPDEKENEKPSGNLKDYANPFGKTLNINRPGPNLS